MTTICYKDGVLAADSQVTAGNIICNNNFDKVERFDSSEFGSVYVAAAGTLSHICEMFTFIGQIFAGETPGPIKFGSGEFQAVMLTEDGKLHEAMLTDASTDITWIECESPWAIGSGAQVALGAMAKGASPEEAVHIASKHDCYTNDNVKVFKASELSYKEFLKAQRTEIDAQIKQLEEEASEQAEAFFDQEVYGDEPDDVFEVESFNGIDQDMLRTYCAKVRSEVLSDGDTVDEPSTVPESLIEEPPEESFEQSSTVRWVEDKTSDKASCRSVNGAFVGKVYSWDGLRDEPPANLHRKDLVKVCLDGGEDEVNYVDTFYWERTGDKFDIVSYELVEPYEENNEV